MDDDAGRQVAPAWLRKARAAALMVGRAPCALRD